METSQLWNLVLGGAVTVNAGAILIALKVFISLHSRVASLENVTHTVERLEKMVESLATSVHGVMVELAEVRR